MNEQRADPDKLGPLFIEAGGGESLDRAADDDVADTKRHGDGEGGVRALVEARQPSADHHGVSAVVCQRQLEITGRRQGDEAALQVSRAERLDGRLARAIERGRLRRLRRLTGRRVQ